jgi:charged multivesicular body protein 7
MRTYKTSTSTLKTLLAHPTLQRDHIDATMSNMSDALADHAEIEQAIQLNGKDVQRAAGVDFDEDEFDAELAAMVQAQEAEGVRRENELQRVKEDESRRRVEAAMSQTRAPLHSPSHSPRSASPVRHGDAQLE